jgi:hypothetical protein
MLELYAKKDDGTFGIYAVKEDMTDKEVIKWIDNHIDDWITFAGFPLFKDTDFPDQEGTYQVAFEADELKIIKRVDVPKPDLKQEILEKAKELEEELEQLGMDIECCAYESKKKIDKYLQEIEDIKKEANHE